MVAGTAAAYSGNWGPDWALGNHQLIENGDLVLMLHTHRSASSIMWGCVFLEILCFLNWNG